MDERKPLNGGGDDEDAEEAGASKRIKTEGGAAAAIAGDSDNKVGRCGLTVLKPVLKAPMVSALEARI